MRETIDDDTVPDLETGADPDAVEAVPEAPPSPTFAEVLLEKFANLEGLILNQQSEAKTQNEAVTKKLSYIKLQVREAQEQARADMVNMQSFGQRRDTTLSTIFDLMTRIVDIHDEQQRHLAHDTMQQETDNTTVIENVPPKMAKKQLAKQAAALTEFAAAKANADAKKTKRAKSASKAKKPSTKPPSSSSASSSICSSSAAAAEQDAKQSIVGAAPANLAIEMLERDTMRGTPVREITSRGRRVVQTNHFSHESKSVSDAEELQVLNVTLPTKPLGLINTSDMASTTPGGPEAEDELNDLSDDASPGEGGLEAQSPQSPVGSQSPQSPAVNPPTPEEDIDVAIVSD